MENALKCSCSLLIELIMWLNERFVKLNPKARKSSPIKNDMFCTLKKIVLYVISEGVYSEDANDKISWLVIIETNPIISDVVFFKYLSEMYPIKIGKI